MDIEAVADFINLTYPLIVNKIVYNVDPIQEERKMSESGEKITINATLEIPVATLTAIVENAKKRVGPDARGIYRVDPAERVNRLVTAFLETKDFDAYARDIANYK